jgi:hypothetical protein
MRRASLIIFLLLSVTWGLFKVLEWPLLKSLNPSWRVVVQYDKSFAELRGKTRSNYQLTTTLKDLPAVLIAAKNELLLDNGVKEVVESAFLTVTLFSAEKRQTVLTVLPKVARFITSCGARSNITTKEGDLIEEVPISYDQLKESADLAPVTLFILLSSNCQTLRNRELYVTAERLMKIINQDRFRENKLGPIQYAEVAADYTINLKFAAGLEVRFSSPGDNSNLESELVKLQTLLDYFHDRTELLKSVNLEFDRQVIVTLR